MATPRVTELRRIRQHIELESSHLEEVIAAVPTGEVRNKLTEANIHLHAARKVIKDLVEASGLG